MNTKSAFRIDVFSIFPKLVDDYCKESLLGRAREEAIIDLRSHDLRDYGDESRRVDDALYGGGAGMLFRPEPIFAAVEAVQPQRPMFLLSPGGRRFDQEFADQLSKSAGFSLLCGRYEGVDHRVVEHLIDGEISFERRRSCGVSGDRSNDAVVAWRNGQRSVACFRKFWCVANARRTALHKTSRVSRMGSAGGFAQR